MGHRNISGLLKELVYYNQSNLSKPDPTPAPPLLSPVGKSSPSILVPMLVPLLLLARLVVVPLVGGGEGSSLFEVWGKPDPSNFRPSVAPAQKT